MYPRNAASPEPIAIGAVVQISDGAVQTSGCTVRIKPIGVSEGDGGGTTAYSTDGIVLYTPTQAETNYTSFILIAKKASCIPVAITVVTSASSVPGRTMPADGSVTAAVIAAGAIDAATFAADVDAEILSYLVDDATRIDASALNTASTAVGSNGSGLTALATAANLAAATATIEDVQSTVDAILVDTGTTIPATITTIDNEIAVIDGIVDDILVDTGTTLPATLATLATAANLATVAGYLDTEIAAILADTNELQTDWANGGRLDLLVDAIKVVTDAITATGTGLTAIPWNASWDAEVQSEVNDALDTAISELSAGVPTATPTIRTAIMLLYMALRNRTTTTATAQTIQNDAGTTIATATLSDDGTTMTKAEFA